MFNGLKQGSKTRFQPVSSSGSGAASNVPFPKGPLFRGRGRGLFSRGRNFHNSQRGKKYSYSFFVAASKKIRTDFIKGSPIGKRNVSSKFQTLPSQRHPPHGPNLKVEEKDIVRKEIQEMIDKQAVELVKSPSSHQYLSSIFVIPKKDTGYRPVINLRNLNSHIPYQHFKMEGLSLLKELLQKGDFMIKIDLKDAYFSVPLSKHSRKYVSFLWEGDIYQFLCLCFGLGPAPRLFTKLLKVPIALLRRLNVHLIIYLDHSLILVSSQEEAEMARNTLIFIFQHLGFTINFQKSVLQPCHLILFLGIEIDSINLKLPLPKEKMERIVSYCQERVLLSGASNSNKGYCKGFNESSGSPLFLGHCSISSSTSVQSYAKTTDSRICIQPELRWPSSFESKDKGGTDMVDRESPSLQWSGG